MSDNNKVYKIAKLNPSISSENIGDDIILWYCQNVLNSIFGEALYVNVPTREHLEQISRYHIMSSDYAFVCGTNLLASNMDKVKQWNINIQDAIKILRTNLRRREYFNISKYPSGKLILMGSGWWQYQENPNSYTKLLMKLLLSNEYMHSVRDSYTEKMLKKIGINNVLNTACPTMWNLTERFCSEIPEVKSTRVVTTLTNYHTCKEDDEIMLDILCTQYKEVYVWLQSIEDLSYLNSLSCSKNIKIIPPNLIAYDRYLEQNETDYVGTRLHGGIRALNYKRKALILAVDNRAIEISRDTNLPVIERKNVKSQLENYLLQPRETRITLPYENIENWKAQFYN